MNRIGCLVFLFLCACEADPPPVEPEPPLRTLVFEMESMEKTVDGCVAGAPECTYARLDFPSIVNAPEDYATDAVRSAIAGFIRKPLAEDRSATTAADVIDELMAQREEVLERDEDYSTPWYLQRKAFVVTNEPDVVSLSFHELSFTGGAHPLETLRFVNIDPRTGETITLGDITVEGREQELRMLGEVRFRDVREIADDVSLSEAGFNFENDQFALTDNFSVGDEGLTFYYNPYDVAPYASGPTELVMTYDELDGLIER